MVSTNWGGDPYEEGYEEGEEMAGRSYRRRIREVEQANARLRAEVARLQRQLDAVKRDEAMVCEMLDDHPRCGECDACVLAAGGEG